MASSSPKVVIVGAGVAGVTTAAWLVNNHVNDVFILEAQDYIGGRVKGVIVDGNNIDLGAQFIHGREGNPAYNIAQKLGTVASLSDDYQSMRLQNLPKEFRMSNGDKIDGDKVRHLLQFLDNELDIRFTKIQSGSTISDGELFKQAYEKFLSPRRGSLSQAEVELYDSVYRWYSAYQKIDNATADLKDVSAWGAGQYKVLPGDRFTNTHGGMARLLKEIRDLVPDRVFQLNSPVTNINWSSANGVGADGKVVLTCKNGDLVEADHVVVTVSTGCMQASHEAMFTPPLPDAFQTALRHIGFGAIGKVFLKWERPFWKLHDADFFDSFELLWLDSHTIHIKSDRCQKKTRFGKPWWYGIQSVETVLDQPNMLEFWLTLDQIEIVEELDDDEVITVCHELLQHFLREYENIPKPVEVYRTKWLTNPYIRGTYSYPKCDICEEDWLHLGKSLPSPENPRVLFAGEAYSIDFISTFHGALLSGLKAADQILKVHGKQSSGSLIDLIGQSKN
ncbi:hypothetical protein BsWGS_04899 [Bradybaena similaris]